MVDPRDPTRRKRLPAGTEWTDLLVPVVRAGQQVYQPPVLADVRQHTLDQLAGFHGGVKRLMNPRPAEVTAAPSTQRLEGSAA